MIERQVKTQAELDKALAANELPICIGGGYFVVAGSATVQASDSATVRASGSATVRAWGSATVQASDSATVRASDSATVRAWGSATVQAWGSATVQAWGSATVQAWGSATVRASDSATVRASGSATVRASDSATVQASDSATVRASDSATVRAWGSATVRAGTYNAVTIHGINVKAIGGNQIVIPQLKTAAQWAMFYGLPVKAGAVTLYKTVRDDYASSRGMFYTPGTTPTAPDWDGGNAECGGGLHFSPRPFMALSFDQAGKRFVACPVKLKDCRKPKDDDQYPEKIKAKGCCGPVYECDIDGKRVSK